jgi:hypothetical protein
MSNALGQMIFMSSLCPDAGFPIASLRLLAPSERHRKFLGDGSMSNVLFLALGAASFAALIGYVFFCERQ